MALNKLVSVRLVYCGGLCRGVSVTLGSDI
jgi:hypothetical protein